MESVDNFKRIFKYYKSNKPKPSFEDVISLVDSSKLSDKVNFIEYDYIFTELFFIMSINCFDERFSYFIYFRVLK